MILWHNRQRTGAILLLTMCMLSTIIVASCNGGQHLEEEDEVNGMKQQAAFIIEGPTPHRVYQRNKEGWADIPFTIASPAEMTGRVKARIVTDQKAGAWQALGSMNGDSFAGVVAAVAAGQNRLEIRVIGTSGRLIARQDIQPLLVGDLWVLAGQSNMQGWGKLVDMDEPQAGISLLDRDHRIWSQAREPLGWAEEAMNWESPRGAGLGLPFAKEILLRTEIPIGLIMSAVGGTSMADWDPGKLEIEPHSLYGDMIGTIRDIGGSVAGVLWYQGENDANNDAHQYLERMKYFVAALRADIGDPQLPFIFAQLSVYNTFDGGGELWNRIQRDQLALESATERTAMVPTIDATLSDPVHLDAASLREVGKRMAWRALELVYNTPVAAAGPRPDSYTWNADRTQLQIQLQETNGRLVPVDRVFGFRVELNGSRLSHVATLTEDGQGVMLEFAESVPAEGLLLWHGAGFTPVVNVKDERGIPLVVFGPVAI